MYFLALAADYDGTIAKNGIVQPETVAALRRLKAAGLKLILVTGRELRELEPIFPEITLFDRVIAENGATLYDPSNGRERLLASPPPAVFVTRLRELEVEPLSVGRCVVATWEPCQLRVLSAIQELGLDLQIIFNKGAVMVMPAGVNKATGLSAALRELDISAHNVVAVGDAENDHAFLQACGCAAAVANALPAVKERADIRLAGDHGAGVIELIENILAGEMDLGCTARNGVGVGWTREGRQVCLAPSGGSVLIIGPSGCGKSTMATALTEQMVDKGFEFCILDPEGDYVDLLHAVPIGSPNVPPDPAQALKLLNEAGVNLVLNTQSLDPTERRRLFSTMLLQTARVRARSGRPQWLIIDEAHQVLPATEGAAAEPLAHRDIPVAILITMHPETICPNALNMVETVIALGDESQAALARFAAITGRTAPAIAAAPQRGQAVHWSLKTGDKPQLISIVSPAQIHKRHAGKYAVGDVGPWRSFYFRGPGLKHNCKAENLYKFLEIAHNIDDPTWDYHLRAGDYSAWFRHVIRDERLAASAARVEADLTLDSVESRRRIRKAICRRYAAPCC
ncbi:HAD family hydrolase [Rhodoligotrophos ferricapiens]|uniref:HAD family hydrolase n=1 Tax=Rhodoligotrophos ferricapiens TaxID=3069264 RepID=UPI00315D26C2